MLLDKVYVSFERRARSLFGNHESTITPWTFFRHLALEGFPGDYCMERSEDGLQSRIHQPNKTLTSFLEHDLRLLRQTQPNATEERKIDFLIRGAED